MEGNSGLPPEIMVLCTTAETKEHAVRLQEWIRCSSGLAPGIAWDPAIPAVCSLIASEQLGNTVVTERRAQQWSQTTPEHFRSIKNEVQRLIITSRAYDHTEKRDLTFQKLVDEFCQASALSHMLKVENVFRNAPGNERWRIDSEIVQAAIFFWACEWFTIPTTKSIEDIRKEYSLSASELKHLHDFLDSRFSSTLPQSPRTSQSPAVASSSRLIPSPLEPSTTAPLEVNSTSNGLLTLEELANEFGIEEDALGGMRFLEEAVREKDGLKELVDWDSAMGRCSIFYWTCSVLKIPSAKHITLRTQFKLSKKDFDKVLSTLDLYRAELRKKLEEFYAGNPALQLLPQGTRWAATSPANLKPLSSSPSGLNDKSMSPSRRLFKRGTGRRGRPPKPKSPPISTEPTSAQEDSLLPLCQGPALHRALILLRSFNVKRVPASDADRVPPRALPALVALLASQQLRDGFLDISRASRESGLQPEEFHDTLATVRPLIDNFHPFEELARHTAFDDLALEHGMSINTVISMLHVRESLIDSRCLSEGMDWDSPLVICSVFFWTCAILKVPEVKQSLLRSRSLATKREFDSMLQLLNSHCTSIRQQLENNSAAGAFWFASPPSASRPPSRIAGRRHPSFYGEQEIYLEELEHGNDFKRRKRETNTPSEYDLYLSDAYAPRTPRKPGRPPTRKLPKTQDDVSEGSVQEPMYRPTVQFPPADWTPPESLSGPAMDDNEFTCPPSESSGSKRGHTRYKTRDYERIAHERFIAWRPEGDEVAKQLETYQHRVERMRRLYGPNWEKGIERIDKGTPFE